MRIIRLNTYSPLRIERREEASQNQANKAKCNIISTYTDQILRLK